MKAAACRAALLSLPKACSPRRVVGEDFRSSASSRVRLRRVAILGTARDHEASGAVLDLKWRQRASVASPTAWLA
jgi:hypothetical protein